MTGRRGARNGGYGRSSLNPIGFALVGPLAAGTGIPATLLVTAALTAGSTLAVLCDPCVRRLCADQRAAAT